MPKHVNWTTVNRLMKEAVAGGVFPGAVLLVSVQGQRRFLEAYGHTSRFRQQKVRSETIFDLASLTKPLATALAVMRLMGQGRLALEQTVASILPPFNRETSTAINIAHLLSHSAGFADWRPFYRELERFEPEQRRQKLKALLVAEPFNDPPGHKMVYSDLGFMVLAWIIETITQTGLDRYVADDIYRPMGVDDLYYIPLAKSPPPGEYAVALGVYYWATGERLPAYTQQGEPIPEASIVLQERVTVK